MNETSGDDCSTTGRGDGSGRTPQVKGLAGAGGFEPPHGGTKIRCLTAWLRPTTYQDVRRQIHGIPADDKVLIGRDKHDRLDFGRICLQARSRCPWPIAKGPCGACVARMGESAARMGTALRPSFAQAQLARSTSLFAPNFMSELSLATMTRYP
jgi:hypothetical protein